MPIKIALAEDNLMLARSIQEKLGFFSEELLFRFHCINGKTLLQKLESDHDLDVILMDIEMPEMDGIEATEIISDRYPEIKIIILTVFDDEQRIFNAIQAGAKGYLLKDEPPHKILESIQMVMEGGAPMSPGIAAKTLELLRGEKKSEAKEKDANTFDLSKREIEILEQIGQGLNYKEISENLYISPFTVRKHIENIYRKLQVNNKIRAIQKATRHRII